MWTFNSPSEQHKSDDGNNDSQQVSYVKGNNVYFKAAEGVS